MGVLPTATTRGVSAAPSHLVRRDRDRFVLVHELHRLEACKALGEETIYGYLVQPRHNVLSQPIPLADAISELIVLLDDRSEIGKAKHRDECDQHADCAEQNCCDEIRVNGCSCWPGPFERRLFCTQFSRHWDFPLARP
jgi:hypothetical protein